MKKQILVLLMLFSVAFIPQQTSAVSVGTVAYKITAGCGGIIFAKAAIGLGIISLYTGGAAAVCSVATVINPVASLGIIPCAGISIGTGLLSYGCAVLSYHCFKEMLATAHPEIIHVHHHYYNDQNQEQNELLQERVTL